MNDEINPIELFNSWFELAEACPEIAEANAMCLATVSPEGAADARMVLLKGQTDAGFVFYSNSQSAKGLALANSPHAALVFYWAPLGKQVRIRGQVAAVSNAQADAYFDSRDRQSKLSAWASEQSQPLESRQSLLARFNQLDKQYADQVIPRPAHWQGYILQAEEIEFWQQADYRLHQRQLFRRAANGSWQQTLLNP